MSDNNELINFKAYRPYCAVLQFNDGVANSNRKAAFNDVTEVIIYIL